MLFRGSPGEGTGYPVFLTGEFRGQSLGDSSWGRKELSTTESDQHTHVQGRSTMVLTK